MFSCFWECRRREGAAGLEDGTAHYLGAAAVRHGFKQLASVGGFPAIKQHTDAVTRWGSDMRSPPAACIGVHVTQALLLPDTDIISRSFVPK